MDLDQIKELISCLESSGLSKLVFKKGDMEILLEKGSHHPVGASQPIRMTAPEHHAETAFHPDHHAKGSARREEASGRHVTSPMVGTFYTSPAPDQPSFVKVGDRVDSNTIVCIVEAMKVLNEVKAGISGTIAEILIENGQPVEFGSRLFRIVE